MKGDCKLINQDNLDKLEQLKRNLEIKQVTKEVGDIDVKAQNLEIGDGKSDIEVKAQEVIAEHVVKEEVKPKRGRKKTEDILKRILDEKLDEHYRKIEQLIKAEINHACYRIYNSVKVEVRRQLGGNK